MSETDLALRVIVREPWAETVGAVLMETLGPFAEEPVGDGGSVVLVFYPSPKETVSDAELLALLSEEVREESEVRVERQAVSRDWVEGWKDHFHPIVIGRVRVRPPWEPALEAARGGAARDAGEATIAAAPEALVDVVINPGLGFGTGLHPTTSGTLALLQDSDLAAPRGPRGALVDVGTGSGILAAAAAKMGWSPVIAFDNDAVALTSARENIVANGVADVVRVHECGVAEAPPSWFAGATVLANMTLHPLLTLLPRLKADAQPAVAGAAPGSGPRRVVVAGVLAGAQEQRLLGEAELRGFTPGRRLYEAEWVAMELFPVAAAATGAPGIAAAVGAAGAAEAADAAAHGKEA